VNIIHSRLGISNKVLNFLLCSGHRNTKAMSYVLHWYTPASDQPKLVIVSSLTLRRPPEVVLSVMVILLSATTCSPFLTHTTEGGLKLPGPVSPSWPPTHCNKFGPTVEPSVTAVRLSTGKTSLSLLTGSVTTIKVLVPEPKATGKERSCYMFAVECI